MASRGARPACIGNWTDLHPRVRAVGHMRSAWRDLGSAVGSRTIGAKRIQIEDGLFGTPVHAHGGDEEIFFVLDGTGLLWQAGETFAIAAGDCIVHRAGGEPHTLRGGEGGLDVVAFGQRRDPRLRYIPRAGVAWSSPNLIELAQGPGAFDREAAAGPPECPPPSGERPANVVALAAVPALRGGVMRRLGAAAGSLAAGLNHVTLAPGSPGVPLHCHSHEEELFVVLAGTGTLVLRAPDAAIEEHSLTEGDVVSRPAGNGVAHSLRGGPQGLTYLAYGTREPGDSCYYPETGRVSLRGLGISFVPGDVQPLS